MKIGLIGNMNNNNFALLRYLRDLGADAHLLLYLNDGEGVLNHFTPEADSWDLGKWSSYIHQTKIPNAIIAALPAPISWLIFLRSLCHFFMNSKKSPIFPITNIDLKFAYGGYDFLLSSGITPATLTRIDYKLDVFYPYSSQVEFLFAGWFLDKMKGMNTLSRKIFQFVQKQQELGIKDAKHVINYEPGITEQALCSIGVQSSNLPFPMVYNREVVPIEAPSHVLAEALNKIRDSSISIVHHSRLIWKSRKNDNKSNWIYHNKNNNWLIQAFAKLISLRCDSNPVLFLFDYGPDVDASKELAAELGIGEYIIWLPKMKRKEILWLLDKVSVGVGEFYEIDKMMWGGTGWEILASGKPFIQGFYFEDGEFENILGHPPPPLLKVRKQEDILSHLLELQDHPKKIESIGFDSRKWFEKYNGIGAASRILSLLNR
jgi:hypothetical protein